MVYSNRRRDLPVNRILCTTGQGLGNLVQKTPALKALREIYPTAHITLLIHPNQKGLLDGWSVVDEVATSAPTAGWDLVINFTPPFWGDGKKFEGRITTTASRARLKTRAEWDVNLTTVLNLKPGFKPLDINPYFPVELPEDLPEKGEEVWVCLAHGCGTDWLERKDYGAERWAEVVSGLLEDERVRVFILGHGERDEAIWDLLPASDRIEFCVGKYSILQSAGVVSRCDCMVGNDTGMAHIASALKVPQVVFFGASSVVKNRPFWGCTPVTKRLECSAECQWGRGCEDTPCRDIDPDEFVKRVMRIVYGEPEAFRFGTWMTTYNRFPFLASTLKSIVDADIPEAWKFVFLDDNSSDPRIIPLLEEACLELTRRGHTAKILRHDRRYGKEIYGDTLNECFDEIRDCRYMVPIQDDFLLNRNFFKAAEKAVEYLDEKMKIVYLILHKAKAGVYENIGPGIGNIGCYHEWWPAVWSPDLWKTADIQNRPSFGGSGTGRLIAKEMFEKGWQSGRLEKSAGIHLGEEISALNVEARKGENLQALDPDLFGRLAICSG
jgi:ADP-heptose:LPS heptosyltransferase